MDRIPEKNGQGNPWWGWEPEDFQRSGVSRELLRLAAAELRERFDREKGGFEGLTEEQEDCVLLFLLEYARRAENDWARAMAEVTLERRCGHGGGLLAYAGLEAYAQTGRPAYRESACGILDDALEELRMSGGCFARPGEDAVSTAWNAQMIAALAKGSRVLGGERYLRAAKEARRYLKTRLAQSDGRLADYGFYCWALLELYEADYSVSCLREAEALADRMADIDRQGGVFAFDGSAVWCGAAELALVRLARLTAAERYRDMARDHLAWLAGEGREKLEGLGLLGMVEELWPRRELVCAAAENVPAWLAPVSEEYRLAALAKNWDNCRELEDAVPYVREFPAPEAGTRLYLCRGGVCEATAEDLSQLYERLIAEGAAV